jgi:general stress protein YciG
LEAAKVRAETTGGAGGENKLLAKVEADIGREKKDTAYQRAFKWGNMPVTKDTSPEMKARIEAEKANLQKFEDDFERRREQARKGGSTTTTATPAPGAKPAGKTVDFSSLPK